MTRFDRIATLKIKFRTILLIVVAGFAAVGLEKVGLLDTQFGFGAARVLCRCLHDGLNRHPLLILREEIIMADILDEFSEMQVVTMKSHFHSHGEWAACRIVFVFFRTAI
jgi:hypothetical protein